LSCRRRLCLRLLRLPQAESSRSSLRHVLLMFIGCNTIRGLRWLDYSNTFFLLEVFQQGASKQRHEAGHLLGQRGDVECDAPPKPPNITR
jgi:hypothetical protein